MAASRAEARVPQAAMEDSESRARSTDGEPARAQAEAGSDTAVFEGPAQLTVIWAGECSQLRLQKKNRFSTRDGDEKGEEKRYARAFSISFSENKYPGAPPPSSTKGCGISILRIHGLPLS